MTGEVVRGGGLPGWLDDLLRPAAWTASALCAQADPEEWFPEKGSSTRMAKAICSRCPVRADCLSEALANGERFGVWGGLSERERRQLGRPDASAGRENAA